MRISTSTMFETGTNQLGTLQTQLSRTQQQLATNRRMLTPADDPIASARALEVSQAQSINTQFATNRQNARSTLSLEDAALAGVTTLLQDAQALTITGGNGAYSASDRATIANELSGRLEDLMGLANSTDGTGGYLFGGFRSASPPFIRDASGTSYVGDQGQRQVQVGSARQIAMSDAGSAVFESNLTGNGTFVTAAALTNTGSAVVSPGAVTDATQLTRENYTLTFAVALGVTTFTITDSQNVTVPPPPALAARPYVSGEAIAFSGMTFDIAGAPADGDIVTVGPSTKQSVFETIDKLIATLRAPALDLPGKAKLRAGLAEANNNLKSALDSVLTAHASVGTRMKELDYLDSTGEDLNIQYAATLSNLQDLDMVKAISLFTQQQFSLEAAQKSFKSLTGLSLFNYL
ncbi:MAG: flagellar hook-associated protein FlgL [Telluria sp.]|nr:flagellar hook-associated protein FlgL [Telluria sp.]